MDGARGGACDRLRPSAWGRDLRREHRLFRDDAVTRVVFNDNDVDSDHGNHRDVHGHERGTDNLNRHFGDDASGHRNRKHGHGHERQRE